MRRSSNPGMRSRWRPRRRRRGRWSGSVLAPPPRRRIGRRLGGQDLDVHRFGLGEPPAESKRASQSMSSTRPASASAPVDATEGGLIPRRVPAARQGSVACASMTESGVRSSCDASAVNSSWRDGTVRSGGNLRPMVSARGRPRSAERTDPESATIRVDSVWETSSIVKPTTRSRHRAKLLRSDVGASDRDSRRSDHVPVGRRQIDVRSVEARDRAGWADPPHENGDRRVDPGSLLAEGRFAGLIRHGASARFRRRRRRVRLLVTKMTTTTAISTYATPTCAGASPRGREHGHEGRPAVASCTSDCPATALVPA